MNKIFLNQKLIIKKNNSCVYQTNETQPLYLCPLTLEDYVKNIKEILPIKLHIIKLDEEINYEIFFENQYFNKLLNVEINIDDKKDLETIKNLILVLQNKKIKISLNIKDITKLPNTFLKTLKNKITYYKIYWNYNNLQKLIKKLNIINDKKALIHIKSYLKLEEINNYKDYIKLFKTNNVDIFQLSKELIPLNKENIIIDKKYEKIIRKLEEENRTGSFIFKSVKNLAELYYPRFELDERNSRNCYACRLKPYLYKEILLPCKVNEKINNFNVWGVKDYNDLTKFEKCGKVCDDCASIYENDILDEINNVIKNMSDFEIKIERI